jgi:tripartite-type tricarboxylate transporter receptor subunit TctC
LDKYLPLKQAIGFALHASAPDEAKAAITAAFDKAVASDVVAEWAKANNYDVSGKSGAEASAIFSKLESTFAWTLWDLGAAKVDPASLGIAKP